MKLSIIGATLIGLSCTKPAFAHDEYPPECCSGRDCRPVADSAVRQVGNYWYVQTPDGELRYPPERVRKPLDDQFHACWLPGTQVIFCFFPKMQGM